MEVFGHGVALLVHHLSVRCLSFSGILISVVVFFETSSCLLIRANFLFSDNFAMYRHVFFLIFIFRVQESVSLRCLYYSRLHGRVHAWLLYKQSLFDIIS